MELFFEILLAACAVFGLWCAMRLITEALICSPHITVAVRVFDCEAAQHLQVLLEQARETMSYRRRMRVVVLYDRALLEDGVVPCEQLAIMRRFCAACHVVDCEKGPSGNGENE